MITFSFIWFWTFFGFEISVTMLFDDLQAAKLRWPDLFGSVDSSTEDWIVEQMIKVNKYNYG